MKAGNSTTRKIFCTIAGSDSGGNAGIQADIKTAQSLGLFATSVITAVTAQNPEKILSISELPGQMILDQLEAVFSYYQPVAWKSGMLSGQKTIEVIYTFLEKYKSDIKKLTLQTNLQTKQNSGHLFYVLDPVMISSNGETLISHNDINLIKEVLLPMCSVATPNADEAGYLTGMKINNPQEQKAAAQSFVETYGCSVLLKAGHLKKDANGNCVDIFYDGKDFLELEGPYYDNVDSHGSGCTYSAAIASCLGLGYDVKTALKMARKYMQLAFARAWRFSNSNDKRFLDHGINID